LHIVDIEPNELRVRVWNDGGVITYKRANLSSRPASNQTLQPTASRSND
jgi:hypothetical protein